MLNVHSRFKVSYSLGHISVKTLIQILQGSISKQINWYNELRLNKIRRKKHLWTLIWLWALKNYLLNLLLVSSIAFLWKSIETQETLGNAFFNQWWIETFQKHLESRVTYTFLTEYLPILILYLIWFRKFSGAQGRVKQHNAIIFTYINKP